MGKKGFLSEEMFEAMGDYPLEYRICHLLIWFAGADADISQEELVGICGFLGGLIEGMGLDVDLESLVTQCLDDISGDPNPDLLQETIGILGDYFPDEKLEELAGAVEDIVGADELTEIEAEFLTLLKDSWRIKEEKKKKDPSKVSVIKKKKKKE
ncbi:MAG: hypothetical protein HY819_07980 [Acidobacteria bacterium]|nr:hypothetical protein [Acidobacteriota bacterium]